MIKKTNTFLLLFTFITSLVSTGLAQEQLTGYVDTDYILSKIPEYEGLEQQLRLISQEWRTTLREMQEEIDRLKQDFETKEVLYSEDVRREKKTEIEQKISRREQYLEEKFGPKGEYFQKQKELLEPIQRRVFEAISAVARREGFDFVFDKAGDTRMLYSRQEWNLNDKVLTELGISVNEVSN